MKIILVALFLISLSSCGNKMDKRLFYVIKEVKLSKEDSVGYISPLFYSNDNFILYNDSTIYYHQMNPWICGRCGTGLDSSKPPFLNLRSSDLKEIPLQNLDAFWKTHIKTFENKHLTISSPTDTIYNPAILKLKKLSGFSGKIMLNIRRCTEEQEFVSRAKFQHIDYSKMIQDWKVGFDDGDVPPTQKTLKFVPPIN